MTTYIYNTYIQLDTSKYSLLNCEAMTLYYPLVKLIYTVIHKKGWFFIPFVITLPNRNQREKVWIVVTTHLTLNVYPHYLVKAPGHGQRMIRPWSYMWWMAMLAADLHWCRRWRVKIYGLWRVFALCKTVALTLPGGGRPNYTLQMFPPLIGFHFH